jgi:hypothetical protein
MKSFAISMLAVVTVTFVSCGKEVLLQGSGTSGDDKFSLKSRQQTQVVETESIDMQETINRWNIAAVGVSIPGPVDGTVDFLWPSENEFPHPTFKGGNARAYEAFSKIFVKFFDTADNMAYLKENRLLDKLLKYISPNGRVRIDTSFREIAADFSNGRYSFMISAATRIELARISAEMSAD